MMDTFLFWSFTCVIKRISGLCIPREKNRRILPSTLVTDRDDMPQYYFFDYYKRYFDILKTSNK